MGAANERARPLPLSSMLNELLVPPVVELSPLERAKRELRDHRLYATVTDLPSLRRFTEHHVICVLDFMWLLKSLQRDLTTVGAPWLPPSDPAGARLIQSIVVDEETDVRSDGRVQSHFEWYLEAMEELGAETGPIRGVVDALRQGEPLRQVLADSSLPVASRQFGFFTVDCLDRPTAVRAAVFLHGREDVIPQMFLPLLDRLAAQGICCDALRGYLQRHIEVDGGEHGPLAAQLLERLYGGDDALRARGEEAALAALGARKRLWDTIAG